MLLGSGTLAFEVKEPDIMCRRSRQPEAPLFSRFVVFRVVLVSVLMTAGTIALFHSAYRHGIAAGFVIFPVISLGKWVRSSTQPQGKASA